ncbi:acyltransferase [Stieleria sp. JC731]|uniref:acyltransferase family protein n=1 Tax=Pirellulaceae TaxID=2691357 RepID=UPI001E31B871|nr:acyltransferase [Stieleria sp. JC731]MCC9601233.1 acyltransferase [Stieleria sp. JC731]
MNERLQSIDFLRGIAILGVLAIHSPHDAPGGFRENPWFFPSLICDYGYLGVHLFVILSGFCIHRSFAVSVQRSGDSKRTWTQFWKRRFWRLYPPYIIAIIFSIVVASTWRNYELSNESFSWDLALHLTLTHHLTNFGTSMGNGAFWSLGMEEQLYLAYIPLLFLLKRMSTTTIIATVLSISVTWRLLTMDLQPIDLGPFSLCNWHFWPMFFLLHWTLGALALENHIGIRPLPGWTRSIKIATITMAVGMLLNANLLSLIERSNQSNLLPLVHQPIHQSILHLLGELCVALGLFCTVNWMLQRESQPTSIHQIFKPIASLGRMSYSVYLVHIPLIYLLTARIELPPTGAGWPIRIVLFSGISIVGGCLFHFGVERWFLCGRAPRIRLRPERSPQVVST